ncbi:GNAT family N-acetyltransferase [Endozoicomonas sp. 8E]|uniref:GNAT family N-acetyltransferase n=1 Tax=Endozoicomonas sp. 8E TaxID=3035692 RepID=UPI00293927BF|nr:GNAT family N-acetyltransferase [Endozoicomonas sp. 8E]WOG27645.1 GNAT family N-acetyltransferase [Endozoicomonas sp. 8E]
MTKITTITLPGTSDCEISLQLLSSNSLAVHDNNQSLLLKISEQDSALITAANESDLPENVPNHLIAASLDYLFSRNPDLSRIYVAPSLAERLQDNQLIHSCKESSLEGICYRSGLYQDRTLWHCQRDNQTMPEIWTENEKAVTHPLRQEQTNGVVYKRYDYQNDLTISFRTLDPEQDLDLFHEWMNQPRIAEFWEMAQSREELTAYLQSVLKDRRTWPMIGCINGEPFGYFELYWALEDRIAPYYDCQPWDRGFHLLVGNLEFLGQRYSNSWTKCITHFLYLDDPRTTRLVGEPRADNKRLLKLLSPAGWSFVKEFDFPHKRAALVNCYREIFFQEIRL